MFYFHKHTADDVLDAHYRCCPKNYILKNILQLGRAFCDTTWVFFLSTIIQEHALTIPIIYISLSLKESQPIILRWRNMM